MCEFCTKHGEGKKWYENLRNYTEEVFHGVSSEKKLKKFLNNLLHSIKVDVPNAQRWKKRLPRIYNLMAYPLVTRHLKKTHFGQVVPLKDAERILDSVGSIVRLPCVCRKATVGREMRYCFGIGMDLAPIFKDTPDFSDFERLSKDEAKDFIRHLDTEGMTHSVWTFETPFIGGLCNCDRNCIAWRFQMKMQLGKAMFKAEYIARIDPLRCNGCKECMKRCYFAALRYDRQNAKCSVDPLKCYGCGICRAVCEEGAIGLLDRTAVPEAVNVW